MSAVSRRGFLRGGFLGILRECGPSAPNARARPDDRRKIARILPTACSAYRGAECRVCVEHCPIPGAIAVERGRPTVQASLCDGCGRCVVPCPAPRPAILLLDDGPFTRGNTI
jgi:Na+-translocating ferredoxin:NAD+ oxidoreductase RNF subunit RnfB